MFKVIHLPCHGKQEAIVYRDITWADLGLNAGRDGILAMALSFGDNDSPTETIRDGIVIVMSQRNHVLYQVDLNEKNHTLRQQHWANLSIHLTQGGSIVPT